VSRNSWLECSTKLELLDGAGAELAILELSMVRRAERWFFGSANDQLACGPSSIFLELAAAGGPHRPGPAGGSAAPESAACVQAQANMDPRNRDRIAFVRSAPATSPRMTVALMPAPALDPALSRPRSCSPRPRGGSKMPYPAT